ncbi:glycosyltransferase family 4 protein [Candidatus Kaiserbacteria bacterium]|nr:glycosyltransferase family 4 protein [Candidatus Kaiserbacteria bacterium]
MVTGDKNLFISGTEAHARLELQKRQVNELVLVFWGHGSLWPSVPKGHFDVVTVQDPFWRGLFGWIIARLRGAKLNIQVHSDFEAETAGNTLRRILGKKILRHADSVRVVSHKLKEQVERIGVCAPIAVLPVFIELERFRSITPVHDAQTQKTILWIGRFEPEKDPEEAVSVWKKVNEAGIDAGLVILGAGSLHDRLNRLQVQSVRGKKNLSFKVKDWQDPMYYLARADVVLCTSLHESWGASIVEALAAGVPVVAPDVGIAREAGAFVVDRDRLGEKVVEVLKSRVRGELKLTLPSAEEWGRKWKESLL